MHQLAQRRHDRPIRRIQLWPLYLTAHDAKLVPQQKQLRFRVVNSQPHINQIEEQPKQGALESEEHRRSKSYWSGDPTPGSLPGDEYVTPTPSGGRYVRLKNEPTDCYDDHMSRRLTATEAKARILALLDDVEGGDEVEITKHGRTVARLVPARGPNALKASQARVAMTTASEEELFATDAAWELR